ncbi:hypothetical protein GCM10023169_37230 [Georgenia halophila]|uniref:Uncharacterized protein n=1 Tax=Georgenia halophila TaxID=620889 RepID=A0ABP8LN75_9MICO
MTIRVLTALAVLVSAAVHLYLWFSFASGDDVLGPGFMLNAVGGVVIALLLLAWRHWLPPLLAIGFGLATLTAFVLATQGMLFDVTASWGGWEVWTAAAAEVVAIVGGVLILARRGRSGSGAQRQHHATPRRAHLD